MTTRLEFCKQEVEKHHKDNRKLCFVVQQLNNLLPTYKEKAALQDFVKQLEQDNQSA